MIRPKKLPRDTNQRAQEVAKLLTGETVPSPEPERSQVSVYLAQIGRTGGLKGGRVRAKNLSDARKRRIAKKAARARWSKREPNKRG